MKLDAKQKRLVRRAQTYARRRIPNPEAFLHGSVTRQTAVSAWVAGYGASIADDVREMRRKGWDRK